MRLTVFLLPLGVLFLAGCANHGVIVQKESRAHPFYESVGVEGMYSFVLRDEAGALHRQMVTPEVYERYAIGQNFNDEQVSPAVNDTTEPKTMQIAMHRPTFAVGRVASATKTVKVQHVASVKSSSPTKTKIAQHSTHKQNRHLATRSSRKKTSHTQVASRSHTRAKIAAAQTKKSKTVAVAAKTAKPWKLTAPTVENTTAPQPAPPAEGPANAKPALHETPVVVPDAP